MRDAVRREGLAACLPACGRRATRRAGTTEVILDVTDPTRPLGEFDRLDGLVNNAGIAIAAPLEDLPLDELRRQLEVNVVGQLAVTQAVLPALRAAKGRIVIVGSIAGPERAAVPRRLRDLEVRARGDGRLAAARARAGRHRGLARRAGHDRDGDLDEAAAAGRRASPSGTGARLETVPRRSRRPAPPRRGAARPRRRMRSSTRSPPSARRRATSSAGTRRSARAIEKLPDRPRDRVLTRALLEGLDGGLRSRPCSGQMMDFQLTLPHILRRVETYFREQGDRHPAPRQELPPLRLRRHGAAREAARGRARRASGSSAATASRRSAGTTTSTMSAYLGIPCGGFVLHTLNLRLHPTDLGVHRQARRRQGGDRRPRRCVPCLEAVPGRDRHRARLRRRGLLRGAARRRVARRLARPGARRERGGGDVLHERDDRPPEGRRLLAPLDDAAHARRRRGEPARASASSRAT